MARGNSVPQVVLRARPRDQRLRRIVRRARTLAPHLDNPVFMPILQSFGRISLLLLDSYAKLQDGALIGEDGELRPSVDSIRRLAETQARLARELGLTPATLRVLGREKRVDLAAALVDIVDVEVDGDGEAED
jgi:hypothetical protein